MMLNYSWQMNSISRKSPNLNFAVAPVPQNPDKPKVNYANYWSYVVAKNKISKNTLDTTGKAVIPQDTRIFEAWKFLRYLTVKPDQDPNLQYGTTGKAVIDSKYDPAKEYISKTGNPSGRRDLIEIQRSDSKIGIFAIQNLLAKSWYQVDSESIETIFADMINQVNRGQSSSREALKSAVNKVNSLITK